MNSGPKKYQLHNWDKHQYINKIEKNRSVKSPPSYPLGPFLDYRDWYNRYYGFSMNPYVIFR